MDFLLTKLNSSPSYQVYNSFQRKMSPAPNSSLNYDDDYYDPVMSSTCTMEHIKTFTSTFFPVLYSILFVTGLMGNTLVVWVLIVLKKVNAITDVYLLNLAFSDLLFVFSLPFLAHYSAVGHWAFGNAMCKIISSAYFVGFYSSAFFVTIMSIDRYLAIVRSVYALRVRTTARGAVTSLALWVVAILASAPAFLFFHEVDDHSKSACIPHYPSSNNGWKIFSNFEVNALGWLMPLGILLFCYYHILENLQKCHTQNKYKAMKLVFIVVTVFFLFWTPINIVLFLDSLQNMYIIDDCHTSKRLALAMELAEAFSFAHCCLNPVIYAFVGEKFKRYLCEAFGKYARFLPICKDYRTCSGHSSDKHSSVLPVSSQSSFMDTVL